MRPARISILYLTAMLGMGVAQSNLPEGPNKALVQRICGKCHGLEGITRARNTKERWDEIVDDMASRGAEGTDDELDKIVEYLATNFSKTTPPAAVKKININKVTGRELSYELAMPASDADAIIKYRTDNGPFKELNDLRKVPGIDAKKVDDWKDRLEF